MLSDYCLPFSPLLVPKGGVSSHRFTELQMYPLHHRKTRSTIAELQSTGSASGTDTSSERALTKISSSLTCKGEKERQIWLMGWIRVIRNSIPQAASVRQDAAHQLGGLQRCRMGVDIFCFTREPLTASAEGPLSTLAQNHWMFWAGRGLTLIS